MPGKISLFVSKCCRWILGERVKWWQNFRTSARPNALKQLKIHLCLLSLENTSLSLHTSTLSGLKPMLISRNIGHPHKKDKYFGTTELWPKKEKNPTWTQNPQRLHECLCKSPKECYSASCPWIHSLEWQFSEDTAFPFLSPIGNIITLQFQLENDKASMHQPTNRFWPKQLWTKSVMQWMHYQIASNNNNNNTLLFVIGTKGSCY